MPIIERDYSLKNKFKEAVSSTLVLDRKIFDGSFEYTWKAFQGILKQIKEKPELIDEVLKQDL